MKSNTLSVAVLDCSQHLLQMFVSTESPLGSVAVTVTFAEPLATGVTLTVLPETETLTLAVADEVAE